MTAEEFLRWAVEQPQGQRYELVGGEVVPMSPERALHTRIKHLVWRALSDALRAKGIHGEVLGDGMSVRIDDTTIYEPDTLVRCGEPVDDETVEVTDPVIVVEVVSPSTRGVDTGSKMADYFRLPSIRHYLVVNGRSRSITHHARDDAGRIESYIIRTGSLDLNPPGITVVVESFFRP
jgi:Uma2 family endonuclease